MQKQTKELIKKISIHQTNKLISGGKRLAWLLPAAMAFGTIISWAFSVRAAYALITEIVEAATPDEHVKGWLKPKLLLADFLPFRSSFWCNNCKNPLHYTHDLYKPIEGGKLNDTKKAFSTIFRNEYHI